MRMGINKSGCDHQAVGVDLYLAAQWAGGNRDNLLAIDSDAAHSIEAGFGVHHPPALQDDVIGLSGQKRR